MKLTLDLIPSSSFYKNARAAISKSQWQTIRKIVLSKAYDLCEICGANPKSLDCHEEWEYKNSIQKLINMIALCKDCHQVKHFGLAELQGKRSKALKHFMKINKMNKIDSEKYIANQFMEWAERSKVKWKLDLSILKTDYNITLQKENIEKNAK